MSKIYAELSKRKYTPNEHQARAYKRKHPNANISILHLAKIKQADVQHEQSAPRGVLAWAIITNTNYDLVKENESQWNTFLNTGFDSRDYDTHRLSLDGSQGLFRLWIRNQNVLDRLNTWVGSGRLVAFYPYNHQEEDHSDTTIKQFLRGNIEWEIQE